MAQLAEITATLGRPLRVLHIGNIANNAYINAKIMRRYGIEADVLMISYYHMMGCPEWEDGEIESLAGTQFEPDWARTKVTGFKRPDWFVQRASPGLHSLSGRSSQWRENACSSVALDPASAPLSPRGTRWLAPTRVPAFCLAAPLRESSARFAEARA